MTTKEAMIALFNGKKVRATTWEVGEFIALNLPDEYLIRDEGGKEIDINNYLHLEKWETLKSPEGVFKWKKD